MRIFTRRSHAWGIYGGGGTSGGKRGRGRIANGAILCAVEVLAIPVLCVYRGWVPLRAALVPAATTVVGIAGLTAVAGWRFLLGRFQEANPFGLRWELAQSSWRMFLDRPWTGWGMGTWPVVYPGFARYDDGSYVNQAHNDWAQWAVEGGIRSFY
ncbi:MAG: O-antigen ligase family protein [Acidobacteriota bacterium]